MSRSASGLVRVFGALSVAATLGLGSMPVFAQSTPTNSGSCASIEFQLANPTPGSRVEAGSEIIQGVAMAANAPNGPSGIDRVDFFLGSRDAGGINLGTAVPGMTAGPFGPGSFQATVDFPTNLTGGHDLWAYAHSSVTGQEAVISEPVAVGVDTSKAFVTPPAPDSQQMMCLGSANGTNQTTTTPMPPSTTTTSMPSTTTTTTTTTTTAATGAASNQSITLEVGNPSPGDTIHVGAYNIIGRALDRSATNGTGIDRVEIFLDNRDQGGMFLGTGSLVANNLWSATINIPSNQTGLHNLMFYAHSSVSGGELAVTVPVTVAP
jgi:hypothetical protein